MATQNQTSLHNAKDLSASINIPLPTVSKVLKILTQGGILKSHQGSKGGYSLARQADQISAAEVIEAIEGAEPAFRCSEIRQQGPCVTPNGDFRKPCEIHSAFGRAEMAWPTSKGCTAAAPATGISSTRVSSRRRRSRPR